MVSGTGGDDISARRGVTKWPADRRPVRLAISRVVATSTGKPTDGPTTASHFPTVTRIYTGRFFRRGLRSLPTVLSNGTIDSSIWGKVRSGQGRRMGTGKVAIFILGTVIMFLNFSQIKYRIKNFFTKNKPHAHKIKLTAQLKLYIASIRNTFVQMKLDELGKRNYSNLVHKTTIITG